MSTSLTVVGVPANSPGRVGARFNLKAGQPLSIGPSREARLSTGQGAGPNVHISLQGEAVSASPGGPDLFASHNGVRLRAPAVLHPGDTLYVEPGWALRLGSAGPSGPLDALESHLGEASDPAWAVYIDSLFERGLALGQWLHAPAAGGDERRIMGMLAELEARAHLRLGWRAPGVLERARLLPQAWERLPGASWVWSALREEPIARFVRHVVAPLAAGQPTESLDQSLATTIDAIRALPAVGHLQTLRLGSLQRPAALPAAQRAFAQLGAQAPRLQSQWSDVVVCGTTGFLRLESCPPQFSVAQLEVGGLRLLGPGRSLVGAHAKAAVRITGNGVPDIACTVTESAGQWVASAAADPLSTTHTPMRVEAELCTSWHLLPGDVLEPLPGLALRFGINR